MSAHPDPARYPPAAQNPSHNSFFWTFCLCWAASLLLLLAAWCSQ